MPNMLPSGGLASLPTSLDGQTISAWPSLRG